MPVAVKVLGGQTVLMNDPSVKVVLCGPVTLGVKIRVQNPGEGSAGATPVNKKSELLLPRAAPGSPGGAWNEIFFCEPIRTVPKSMFGGGVTVMPDTL